MSLVNLNLVNGSSLNEKNKIKKNNIMSYSVFVNFKDEERLRPKVGHHMCLRLRFTNLNVPYMY